MTDEEIQDIADLTDLSDVIYSDYYIKELFVFANLIEKAVKTREKR